MPLHPRDPTDSFLDFFGEDPDAPEVSPTLGLSPFVGMAPGIAGDVLGPIYDADVLINSPEERTLANFGMAAAGALPWLPSIFGSVKHITMQLNEAAYKAYLKARDLAESFNDAARQIADPGNVRGLGIPSADPTDVRKAINDKFFRTKGNFGIIHPETGEQVIFSTPQEAWDTFEMYTLNADVGLAKSNGLRDNIARQLQRVNPDIPWDELIRSIEGFSSSTIPPI